MKVWRILQSLETLEASMARYYEALRLHYGADAELACFFARMRDEELSHRDIVRYQQRVMFKTPEAFTDLKDFDQSGLERATSAVEDLIIREPDLTLNESLRAAVRLEAAATEQHYRNVVGQASPSLGRLVQSLGSCDEEHAARLGAFVRSHGEIPAQAMA